jgi:uncharacterized integral membrane protein
MHPTFLIVISIVVAAVVFAAQNTEVVSIDFLFWEWRGSLALILLFSFLLGIVAGVIGVYSSRLQRYFHRRRAHRQERTQQQTSGSSEMTEPEGNATPDGPSQRHSQ